MRTNEENQNMKTNEKKQMIVKYKLIRDKMTKKPETLVAVHTHTHTHTGISTNKYLNLKLIETVVLII